MKDLPVVKDFDKMSEEVGMFEFFYFTDNLKTKLAIVVLSLIAGAIVAYLIGHHGFNFEEAVDKSSPRQLDRATIMHTGPLP